MKNQRTMFFVLTAALLALSGCKDVPQKGNSSHSEEQADSSYTIEQTKDCYSVTLADGSGADSAHVQFVLPCYADKQVSEAIAEQVNEALGGSYEGSYSDVESMARHYLTNYMKEIKEERKDYDGEMPFERDLKVWRSYETDRLVTINVQMYQYSGGAHGGTFCYGLSFRKSDGRQMGMNTLNNLVGDEGWSSMQKEGLMEYFDVKTDSALQDCLLDVETYFIPAPQMAPYFSEKGLEFVYQQYEIAPYAAGLPSYTIPYRSLDKYLNATGRRLLK